MKKDFTGYFLLDWGTYQDTTFFAIGLPFNLLEKKYRKLAKSENKEVVKNHKEELEELINNNNKGFFWMYSPKTGNEQRTTILWLKDWKNDWEHYETLIHELFHAVMMVLGTERGMLKDDMYEDEAMAYQLEYLFKQCRKELNNRFDTFHKKLKKR